MNKATEKKPRGRAGLILAAKNLDAIYKERAAALEKIARQHLHVETLETRSSDRLDFYDCAVWNIKAALEAAYLAGANSKR